MVDPDRNPLQEVVEVDESELPFRSRHDPSDAPRGGRSAAGKLFVAGAVELSEDGHPRRIRLDPIRDFSAATLRAFLDRVASPGACIITDGWLGYEGMPNHQHVAKVVGTAKAHEILRWVHRVFSNLKTWALGVYHGLRKVHLRRYLDEFVFRWNRRRHTRAAFDSLLGIGVRLGPATYRDFVSRKVYPRAQGLERPIPCVTMRPARERSRRSPPPVKMRNIMEHSWLPRTRLRRHFRNPRNQHLASPD